MKKKLLVINFFFPPIVGIGGRRWTKFSRCLAEKGYEVHAVGAANPIKTESNWSSQLEHENITKYNFSLNYPKDFLFYNVDTLVSKLKYHLLSKYYSMTQSKRIYDPTFKWGRDYQKKVLAIIEKEGIENVIITGPPFYYIHALVQALKGRPEINLIVDFRDPWVGAENFGLGNLSGQKLENEKQMMLEVFDRANVISSPSIGVIEAMGDKINFKDTHKYLELKHGYDEQALQIREDQSSDDGLIRLVYGGALYIGTDVFLNKLVAFLDDLKTRDEALYKRLRFEFYTPEFHMEHLFHAHQSIVSFSNSIGQEIFNKIADASLCLILMSYHNKNFRTTKYFEFLTQRVPYLVVGPKGYTAQFTEENKLGTSVDVDDSFARDLEQTLRNIDQVKAEFNNTFDIAQHSFEARTEELIKYLK